MDKGQLTVAVLTAPITRRGCTPGYANYSGKTCVACVWK